MRHLYDRSKYGSGLKREIAIDTRDRNFCNFSLINYIVAVEMKNNQAEFLFVHGCPQNPGLSLSSKTLNQMKKNPPNHHQKMEAEHIWQVKKLSPFPEST